MTGLMCLTLALYFETRGESVDGKLAVADVILNRVEDPRYPDTICDVIKEDSQFSFMFDGKPEHMNDPVSAKEARQVALDALNGQRLGITSTHYHTVEIHPVWASAFSLDGIVGNHVFYTNETKHK